MPSFDIVNRIDLQEVDNAVNITKKAILSRYDFRGSKTEVALDKKEQKIWVTTEDDMKMRAVQEALIENLVRRKVDRKCLEPKPNQMASQGMVQREIAIKDGCHATNPRACTFDFKKLACSPTVNVEPQNRTRSLSSLMST